MSDVGGAAAPAPQPAAGGDVPGANPNPNPAETSSIWTRIQEQGVQLPPEVIDQLAELDLELSEGENKKEKYNFDFPNFWK